MSIWTHHYPPEEPLYGWTQDGKPIRELPKRPPADLDKWAARFSRKLDAANARRIAKLKSEQEQSSPLTEEEARTALKAAQAHLRDAVARPEAHLPPKPIKTPPASKSPADLLAEWERRIASWSTPKSRQRKFRIIS